MKHRRVILATLLAFVPGDLAFSQGALNPPGGPAPTMKTLDQLDAKLDQTNAKLEQVDAKQNAADAKAEKRTPISSVPYTITSSGSYYLTGSLTGPSAQSAVRIDASHVTVDLNGFALNGVGSGFGISAPAESKHVVVRNGSLRGWNMALRLLGEGAVVENVQVTDSVAEGIVTGPRAMIQSCLVHNSAGILGGDGIDAGAGSLVAKCTVSGMTRPQAAGIKIGVGGSVVDCVAENNDAPGGYGIFAAAGSSVVRCQVRQNTGTVTGIHASESRVVDCISTGNDGAGNHGISALVRTTVSGCVSTLNGGDGINVFAQCTILNNSVGGNGSDGIEVRGTTNRIEANNATGNTAIGIRASDANATGNLIIRNSSAFNTGEEYGINTSANATGPIVTQANVATNTNPHANFDFD